MRYKTAYYVSIVENQTSILWCQIDTLENQAFEKQNFKPAY